MFEQFTIEDLRAAHEYASSRGIEIATAHTAADTEREGLTPWAEHDQVLTLVALRAVRGEARTDQARDALTILGDALRAVSDPLTTPQQGAGEFVDGRDPVALNIA